MHTGPRRGQGGKGISPGPTREERTGKGEIEMNGTNGGGTHPVRAMSLLPGDVVHIAPHTVAGHRVNCPDANVELRSVHWGDETHREIVLDYGPWLAFPGSPAGPSGSVVYGRVSEVALLWHGVLGGAA